jgi:multisubunit Na+/H+ antiporter MnhE subunit
VSRILAAVTLAWRFARAVASSAAATAWVILAEPDAPRRGVATLHYGELSETGAVLLGALVTLTPGTSTLDVDPVAHELRVHLLDVDDLDATIEAIERELLQPLRSLFGERR